MMLRDDIEVDVEFLVGTIIHDMRHTLAETAIKGEYDYVLWVDSDMVFDTDVLLDLLADDKDIVTAVCFMRRAPYHPCIYSKMRIGLNLDEDDIEKYLDYPKNGDLFEVEACGFAMILMRTKVLKHLLDTSGHIFFPVKSTNRALGEDLSFCIRARRQGFKIWCDPKPRIGHIGKMFVDANSYWTMKELTS
jgi:GT2 family glycosyltransferase